MNIDEVIKRISKTDGLSKTLGMHFISTPEPDTLRATMKVDERNRQPFGFLSGGINVSGSHVLAVSEGDTVTAYAKLVHKGRTLHTWEVAIKNTADELICTVQVTNYVFTPKKKDAKMQESKKTEE